MDGFGWLIEKRCLLMEAFGWKPDFVKWKITSGEGWVYYNWARQNKASLWGSGERTTSDGYLRQEIRKLKERHGRRQS